jgi:hypothetical protein
MITTWNSLISDTVLLCAMDGQGWKNLSLIMIYRKYFLNLKSEVMSLHISTLSTWWNTKFYVVCHCFFFWHCYWRIVCTSNFSFSFNVRVADIEVCFLFYCIIPVCVLWILPVVKFWLFLIVWSSLLKSIIK